LENNAVAARKVRDENDRTQAAIAGDEAGQIYGLKALAGPINHSRTNTTRFLILSKVPLYRAAAEKISLCFELPHQSGSLYNMLGNFIFNHVNMRMIESRPIPDRNWEYRFFVDIEGNLEDPAVINAIHGIEKEANHMKILGNY
ncbi:MAG: prephenate dehydratase domain-containing protein, partial [Clostridium sp.]